MNTINIDDIGVVSLSANEENEITGGFTWGGFWGTVAAGAVGAGLYGAAAGAGGGTVVLPFFGTIGGALVGGAFGVVSGGLAGGLTYLIADEVAFMIDE